MTFHSILFERTEDIIQQETLEAPDFFVDLNLDQIIDAITAGRQEYNLKPFFYTSLHDIDAITYRHEILRELDYTSQKQRWFVDAVEMYCDAVHCLVHDLSLVDLQSRGFLAFREYVTDYANSSRFTALLAETKKLKADLSAVKYCLLIKGNSIKVRIYESEIDYSADVEETFAKFKQGAVKDHRVKFRNWPDMDHVEAQILDLVAKLYPDIFLHLDDYCAKNGKYLDETIAIFDREIQFYVAYLEYIATLKRAGLKFCCLQ